MRITFSCKRVCAQSVIKTSPTPNLKYDVLFMLSVFSELDPRVHHQRHLLHLAQERQQGGAGAEERRAAVFPLRLRGRCRVWHLRAALVRVKGRSGATVDRCVSCLSYASNSFCACMWSSVGLLYADSLDHTPCTWSPVKFRRFYGTGVTSLHFVGIALVFISFGVDREVLSWEYFPCIFLNMPSLLFDLF